MGLNQKHALTGRKESIEKKLKERLAILSKEGIEAREINKDTLVKKLRANIRTINSRLNAIDAIAKKTAELAKIKKEKAAIPPKEAEVTKGKKEKEPPVEGKEKKKKKKE